MFDPERDVVARRSPFLLRLAIVALVTAAIGMAIWPSATGFRVGAEGERSCVAVIDGWHAYRAGPSQADIARMATTSRTVAQTNDAAACIPPSRHRLIVSGIGLLAVAFVASVALLMAHARKPRQQLAR